MHWPSYISMQAYKRGMTFPRYLFLSYYWYTPYWWVAPILRSENHMYDPENCTAEELTGAIFGSLAMDYTPTAFVGSEDEPTDVGFVSGIVDLNHALIVGSNSCC